MKYNKTQLNPDDAFERHVFHRDMFAHYLRWSHVLRLAKIGMKILDFGCGSGNLYEIFYRNKFAPEKYLGLDIRGKTIEINKNNFPKAEWEVEDLINMNKDYGKDWDIICSFEVIEHVGKENGKKFLSNIAKHCNENTIILLSTPCYDETIGAAENHIINGVVGEYTYDEIKELISKCGFNIVSQHGTFASIKDYKSKISQYDGLDKIYNKLHEYYDSNLLSVLMAPLFPEHSRNVIWKLSLNAEKEKLWKNLKQEQLEMEIN